MSQMTMYIIYVTDDHVYDLCHRWPCIWSMSQMTMYIIYVTDDHVYYLCHRWPCILSMSQMTMYIIYVTDDHVYYLCHRWPCILSMSQMTMYIIYITDDWPCICFICHSHNPVFFHFSWHHWNLKSRVTRRLSVVQQKMLSREPDLIPDFLWGFHCTIFSFLCTIVFWGSMGFFSFGNVLSVLQFTDSDYLFGIF
jgi:hypothetical protein